MQSILLLGDSLTEQGFRSNWASRLAEHYVRRAHIINSGLSGYNSRWVLDILRDPARKSYLIPPHLPAPPLFVTLLLGSNDMCTNEWQPVPIDEYQRNMAAIIQLVRDEVRPQGGIFVMTPPPVDELAWGAARRPDRTLADVRRYRAALLEVVAAAQADAAQATPGNEVVLVDLHTAVLRFGDAGATDGATAEVTYDKHAPWTRLLVDGLHFNDAGGALMVATLLDAVRKSPQADRIVADKVPIAPSPCGRRCSAWRRINPHLLFFLVFLILFST
ncbi:esterase [Strigomonas culicis]|uniref:Esterase n=1 Tax=Strigomonas culicis TaxID=28005 RepID=S9VGN9_9TRYP|nr:esterase [Strigomonas culicis]|eukprot:EPY22320.1 esterase [Strigomonas culicis]